MTAVLIGIACGLVVVILLSPTKVEYVEHAEILGPATRIYDCIRFQRDLMRWSAWPPETKSECMVEGEDGVLGARTVFLDKKARKFGFQEIIELENERQVTFRLESKGPPHKPVLTFFLIPVTDSSTQVVLYFENQIAPPFHVLQRLLGIVRWTRNMHKKDLDGLKRFVERNEDYRGNRLDG